MIRILCDWITPMLADTTLKGTAALLLAMGLVFVFRKATAAMKHYLWTVALISLILLPVLTLVLPGWDLPIRVPSFDWPVIEGDSSSVQAMPGSAPNVQEVDTNPASMGHTVESTETTPEAMPNEFRIAGIPVSNWIAIVWLAGALLSLAPFLIGFIVIRGFRKAAVPVDNPALQALINELHQRLHLNYPVRILISTAVKIPTMYGIFRSTVLLPSDLDTWPQAKQEAVLLHELGHVARNDCLTASLARLGLTLQWFNPLAWVAARRMLFEREKACDDLVLSHGSRASEYADYLLEIVRTAGTSSPVYSAALSMARKSQFEGRFLAILDNRLDRAALSARRKTALPAFSLLVLLPLAGLRCTHLEEQDSSMQETAEMVQQEVWEGWAQYRGRPDHNNYREVDDRIVAPMVLWKTTWTRVPAVVDNDVYAGGEALRLIDLHTGTLKASWKPGNSEGEPKVQGTPVVLPDRVIVHTTAGQVHALDRGLTRVLWTGEAKGAGHFSGNCDQGIYVLPAGRELIAFDATTGERRWTRKYSRLYAIQMSPAIADNKVLFGLPSTLFYALDLKTGEELWFYEGEREFAWTDPVVVDGRIFVGDRGGVINALSLEDGTRLWSWKSGVTGLSVPGIFPGSIMVGFSKVVISFDQATGAMDSKKRFFRTNFNPFGSPTRVGKTLYFGNLDGHLYAFDYETEKLKWSFETTGDDAQVSDFVYHKDILLVSTTEGLYAIGNHPDKKPCKPRFVLTYQQQ